MPPSLTLECSLKCWLQKSLPASYFFLKLWIISLPLKCFGEKDKTGLCSIAKNLNSYWSVCKLVWDLRRLCFIGQCYELLLILCFQASVTVDKSWQIPGDVFPLFPSLNCNIAWSLLWMGGRETIKNEWIRYLVSQEERKKEGGEELR